MKNKYIGFGFLGSMALVAAGLAFGAYNSLNKVQTKADTAPITVYYAISDKDVGSYKVKLNVNRQGDADNWRNYEMTQAGTYGEWKLYSGTYEDVYGGAGTIQFQLYNGDTWVSQDEAFTSWTSNSVYSGKVWIHGHGGWFSRDSVPTAPAESADIYINAYTWGDLYLYTFEPISGGNYEQYGGFPGKQIGFVDNNLQFNGPNKLQKVSIPYANSSNVRFVLSDGTKGNKTGDLSLTAGAYYEYSGGWVAQTGAIADAAAFVYDLNAERLAVSAHDDIKSYSICGLNAGSWVTRYNGLGAAKAYVDDASIYTYKDAGSSGADTRVTFSDVMTTLADRAAGAQTILPRAQQQSTNVAAVASVGVAGVAALGGFIFFRKRKHI